MSSLVEPQFKTALELLAHPPTPTWCPYSSGWLEVMGPHPFRHPYCGVCTRFEYPIFIVPYWVYVACMQGSANCPYKHYKEGEA